MSSFLEQLQRLRSGDDAAVSEFVSRYEPYLRRAIRFRLSKACLTAAADSVDVCQSVLGSFLIRFIAGAYDVRSEEYLRRLLGSIANKKFLQLSRREHASKRDRRLTRSLQTIQEPGTDVANPTSPLELSDLITYVVQNLSLQDRQVFEWRKSGRTWNDIGAELGVDSVILRKRFSRSLQKLIVQLRLEDDHEE